MEKTSVEATEFATSKVNSREVHVEVIKGSEALVAAIRLEKPKPWTPTLLKLYAYCAIAFLCSSMNGTSLDECQRWPQDFGLTVPSRFRWVSSRIYTNT